VNYDLATPVEIHKLSASELLHIGCDSTGKLVLVAFNTQIDQIHESSTPTLRKLTALEVTHLKAAFYWLNVYEPEPDASKLEQIRGYLEAFHHLCEMSAWHSASQILFTSTKTSHGKELYEQLRSWGYYAEQVELYSRLLGKLNSEIDCFCLQGLGRAYSYLDQVPQAMNYYQQHLELARQIGNRQAEAQALGGLVGVYSSLAQHQTAINCLQQQLAIAREIKASNEEGQALGGLGAYYILRGNYRKGMKYCQQALAIAQRAAPKGSIAFLGGQSRIAQVQGDQELSALVLGWMGGTHLSRGRYKQAIKYLQQQLTISIQIGNQCQRYLASYYLGNAYMLLGQFELAIEYLTATLNFARETASKATEASTLDALGSVYSDLKQYQDAIAYYKQALEISRGIGKRTTEAAVLFHLSFCYGCLKQPQLAIDYCDQAFTIADETKHQEAKGLALAHLANVYWHQNKYFLALWFVIQSLLILPPWASANGRSILKVMLTEIIPLVSKLNYNIKL
jgi:tetratricopeptide (TPR) repeat protein